MGRRYGWVKDSLDPNDYSFSASASALNDSPEHFSLREMFPEIVDQGPLGSCVANSVSYGFQFCQIAQKAVNWQPARRLVYYNCRMKEGTVNSDSGSQIRTGCKVLAQYGCVAERLFPYDVKKFRDKPSDEIYAQSLENQTIKYAKVEHSLNGIRGALLSGFPISFGFLVYPSFERGVGSDGRMPMPGRFERPKGGHAVTIVGYDDKIKYFEVANSWGKKWGHNGFFYMPYDFMLDPAVCSDFWVQLKVEAVSATPEPVPPTPDDTSWNGASFNIGVGILHVPAREGDTIGIKLGA